MSEVLTREQVLATIKLTHGFDSSESARLCLANHDAALRAQLAEASATIERLEQQVTDADEAIGHYQAEAHRLEAALKAKETG